MNLPPPDLSACADEPIRVPGAIQPHGWLLVLSEAGDCVAYSANWPSADAARRAAAQLPQAVAPDGHGPAPVGTINLAGRVLDVIVHRSGNVTVVELEPA